MAAGLGFKDFVTGEVLTAADVDGYLMQGVWVFASAAARDAAVTAPQEGNFAYLKDTNVTTYYTGSAWANLDTTGMTNPMTTTGDTIYSSSGSTPARLGIGSTGQVLTVAGGVPSWAAPAGGGKVLQVVSATTTTPTTISSTSLTDTTITATITPTLATSKILVMISASIGIQASAAEVYGTQEIIRGSTSITAGGSSQSQAIKAVGASSVRSRNYGSYIVYDAPATTSATTYKLQGKLESTASSAELSFQLGNAVSTIILMEIGA